ncbi:hypothetical protein [Gymnodinialimonas ulvae]|uniref:hypothetical protein n=1 Tax=Gymnodinialimonas ulvae TaxID=3126504 RepID=UPI00309D903C
MASDQGNEPPAKPAQPKVNATREDRLKAALKANMARRKAQARARAQPRDEEANEHDKN